MRLDEHDKMQMPSNDRFYCTFKMTFDVLCEYSFDELIEKAKKDYGSLKKFFETVYFEWNSFWGRNEFRCQYGNGALGYLSEHGNELFNYIENTDYSVVSVWQSDEEELSIRFSVPRIYKKG